MAIVRHVIRADTRVRGSAGLVIADHVFDDGVIWPALFECGAEEDPDKRLADMIPQREADRAADDARKTRAVIEQSAETKTDAYVRSLSDDTLRASGLTNEEIDIVKQREAATETARTR